MRKRNVIDRRRLMIRAAEVAGAALMLGGCDRLVENDTTKAILASAERLTARVQRLVSPARSLAREYTETDLSPEFRANGTIDPDDDDYQEQSAKGFADWSLDLGGLVERPAKFSLADLRALPVAHANHSPRLRGRLELYRKMERCACQRSDRTSRTKAGSALFDVLLRRPHERR
jgi:hypothetical protein